MSDDPVCAVIAVLVSNHAYGTPMSKDNIVARAAVEHDDEAKSAFEYLKDEPFIIYNRTRGLMLDNSQFGEL